MDSVSSFLALASHEEESFLLQSLLITDCLRDLSNLKKQFYAAAEYYEVSYRKNQHKHALLDGFNENAIKAFVHTVDNLGVMANKVNRYLEDKFNGVPGITELQISSTEQGLRTDQEESHDARPHKQKHSLASKFPKYKKRYTLPAAARTNVETPIVRKVGPTLHRRVTFNSVALNEKPERKKGSWRSAV